MDNKNNKKNIAIDALKALAADPGEKSDVAKLREIIDDIELTLASGVSREKVLETLRSTLGIKMSLTTFETNLYRIRKKKKQASFKETPKTNQHIKSGSQQLIAISTIETKPNVTDTVSSKKFISPGDIKNQRIKGMEEAIKLQEEIENINYEENQ